MILQIQFVETHERRQRTSSFFETFIFGELGIIFRKIVIIRIIRGT